MSPPVFAAVVLVLLGLRGAAAPAQSLSQQDKKDMVRSLLKSLETRDPAPLAFINPGKFMQHDPRVEDGLEGFKRFVACLPADARVNTVRIFADGDIVGGKMVEHWDVLQTLVSREQSKNSNGEF